MLFGKKKKQSDGNDGKAQVGINLKQMIANQKIAATENVEVFGTENVLPAHQGRACENILASALVKPGQVALMNFHFTTTKAHITRMGGTVEELVAEKGLAPQSDDPFKGDFDLGKLRATIEEKGAENLLLFFVSCGWIRNPCR